LAHTQASNHGTTHLALNRGGLELDTVEDGGGAHVYASVDLVAHKLLQDQAQVPGLSTRTAQGALECVSVRVSRAPPCTFSNKKQHKYAFISHERVWPAS